MTGERALNLEREKLAAAMVARWVRANPTMLEGWVIEQLPDGGSQAVVTLRQPLTPEEWADYREIMDGGRSAREDAYRPPSAPVSVRSPSVRPHGHGRTPEA